MIRQSTEAGPRARPTSKSIHAICRYDEWLASMLDWKSVQDSPEWLEWISLAFAAFDSDGSGTIGMEDLTALLCGGKCVVGPLLLLLLLHGLVLVDCSALSFDQQCPYWYLLGMNSPSWRLQSSLLGFDHLRFALCIGSR